MLLLLSLCNHFYFFQFYFFPYFLLVAGASQRDLQWYDHEWEAEGRPSRGVRGVSPRENLTKLKQIRAFWAHLVVF